MIDLAAFRHPVHGDAIEIYSYDRVDGVDCVQAKYRNGTAAPKYCAWWVQGTDGIWYVSHGDVKLDQIKPYHWSQLDNPRTKHLPIIVSEGPKDADALACLGFVATDGKVLAAVHAEWFSGRDVVVVQDRDPPSAAATGGGYGLHPTSKTPGERYAEKAARIIRPAAKRVALFTFPGDGIKDASDWCSAHPGTETDKRKILETLFQQALEQADGSAAESDATPEPADEPASLQLPDHFWQARRWLTDLRFYAWSRRLDPDLLLGAVLARIAALLPAGTCFDSGVHSDRSSLNLLVAGIGHSGAGKSGALAAADSIVPAPEGLDVVEGPLGSGEGIAEAFVAEVEEKYDDHGKEKSRKVRKQVRRNAFLFLDEGEVLFRIAAQAANTTLQVLRSTFVARTIGAMNASADRRRSVKDYNVGIFLGFQPATVGSLLADVAGGTPQRFLFLKAGPRPQVRPSSVAVPVIFMPPAFVPVLFSDPLRAEVQRLLDAHDDAVADMGGPDWESHSTLLKCKLAALLCVIDHRQIVTDADWDLAGVLVEISRRVRDWLLAEAERQAEFTRQARIDERAATAQAAALAVRNGEARVEKLARALARKVHEAGQCGRCNIIKSTVRKEFRHLANAVIEHAEGRCWIIVGERHFYPGSCIP